LLNSAVGLGQIVGAAATVVLVGRRRLAAAVVVAAVVAGVTFGMSGLVSAPLVAVLLIGLFGASKLFFDIATRTLLQRLLPDRLLLAVFGLQESLMMAAFALGSLAAPLFVEGLGPRGAFAIAGAFLPVAALLAYSRLRRLDGAAQVPADVLRLLLDVPLLTVLPPRVVERLALEAHPVVAQPGEAVVAEGDPGNRFFVIDQGRVEVTREDRLRDGHRRYRRLHVGGGAGHLPRRGRRGDEIARGRRRARAPLPLIGHTSTACRCPPAHADVSARSCPNRSYF
jgi:hypothetical protein